LRSGFGNSRAADIEAPLDRGSGNIPRGPLSGSLPEAWQVGLITNADLSGLAIALR
jgi:hypothetical protein